MLNPAGATVRSGQHCAGLLRMALCVTSFACKSIYIHYSLGEIDLTSETIKKPVSLLGETLTLETRAQPELLPESSIVVFNIIGYEL